MHLGRTTGPGRERPFLAFADGGTDGAVSADGRVAGAYVHGLFADPGARQTVLGATGATALGGDHDGLVDAALDEIAVALAAAFDIEALARVAGLSLRS
jgi:adenosylcobyric acid synthase